MAPPFKFSQQAGMNQLFSLRNLFNLGFDRCEVEPDLGKPLRRSKLKDVLYVAVDIESNMGYKELKPNHSYHFGISILDARDLHSILLREEVVLHESSVIHSLHFQGGDASQASAKRYIARASGKFLFGTGESVSIADITSRIESLLSTRDFVLVTHGGNNDLIFLLHLNFNLEPLWIMDTQKIAAHIYNLGTNAMVSLQHLLTSLGIPFVLSSLHAAGNDAHFTLRALLVLAAVDAGNFPLPGSTQQRTTELFLRIGLCPAPKSSESPGTFLYSNALPARPQEGTSIEHAAALQKWSQLAKRQAEQASAALGAFAKSLVNTGQPNKARRLGLQGGLKVPALPERPIPYERPGRGTARIVLQEMSQAIQALTLNSMSNKSAEEVAKRREQVEIKRARRRRKRQAKRAREQAKQMPGS